MTDDLTTKTARKAKLDVCPRCGWYAHSRFSRDDECNPAAGKLADTLSNGLPNIPATKLGYGRDMLVFEPDDNFHIRFCIDKRRPSRPFRLEDVWSLGHMSTAAAADLVEVLAAWRSRHQAEVK